MRAGNCRRRGRTHLLLRGPHAHHGPIIPKEFFHTAGNFGEHHEEVQKAGFSHPVLPWIMFFQNVDAIIGPDEPIVYPEHLTEELDYELELAVVLKKSGKHFSAIIPCTAKHPLCWPRRFRPGRRCLQPLTDALETIPMASGRE